MNLIEIYRINPIVSNEKYYEYAESTCVKGKYPNQKYYTTNIPLYVGRLIKTVTGGCGDGRWRTDYFEDNYGTEHIVNYSYEGTTCFREVPQLPIPSLEE